MATSQDFANFICGPKLHNRYLMYLFRFMAPEWNRLMAGSTHNTIYMPTFEALQILLPPILEQKAIAEALGDADALVDALEQILAKKRDLKQGAMQELLTGKRRLPGFGASGKFKSTDAGVLPADWNARFVRDIATIRTGPFGTLLKASEYSETEGVPLISVGEIREGYLKVTERTPHVSVLVTKRLPQYLLREGDIVFGRKGAVERSALICAEQNGWFLGSDGLGVRTFKDYDSQYISYQVRSAFSRSWLIQNATGSTMPSLNQSILGQLAVPLAATKAEQTAIAAILSDMGAEIAALEQKLAKAQAVKLGMMQQLLTGQIRLV